MLLRPDINLPEGLLRKIRDTPGRSYERGIIEKLWNHFKPYADGNFISAFAKDFQSRFWEMYLGTTLLELGCSLRPRVELGNTGPDICLLMEGRNIWLEAIAVGTNLNDIADMEDDTDPVDDQVILRYCSAITEKFRKYKKYLDDGIIKDSECYVIAVNGSRIPFSLEENNPNYIIPNIVKAVLPFGTYTEIVDVDTREVVKAGYSYRDKIYKETGSAVQTNLFTKSEFSGISGILFSNADITIALSNKKGDFIFVHNHNAINPVRLGWLKIGREYFANNGRLNVKLW